MNVYINRADNYSDMQGPCDEGYHVPQLSEWEGIKEIMDGLGLSTGTERKNKLHMPLSGYRQYSDANHIHDDAFGHYATNSIYNDSYPDLTKCLMFSAGTITVGSGRKRSDGLSIRGFYNSFVIPTSSWTIIQGTLGSAGIFWNQDDGLISITSDGSTGYTIMDKNLGATTVYNNGDTLSEANCGKFYQWGNNYGFHWSGSVTTSSTQVNASGYGPGNYYSSSTFIIGSNDWSSVHNDNLRGGVSGVGGESELKNSYIGEVYEYSYDFRNKSTSQITADGWSIVANYIQLGTNGISGTSSTVGRVNKTINLSGAKKCIFKANLYISGGSGNRGYTSPGFANANGSFRANGVGNYPGYGLQLNYASGTRRSQFNENTALNGNYTSTLEIDLTNNIASLTLDGVGTITNNNPDLTTFLDQQYITITVQQGNSRVKDISIIIEY